MRGQSGTALEQVAPGHSTGGIAEPSGGGAAEVATVPVPDLGRAGDAKVVARHVEEQEGPKLEDATVVVSGGRGLGSSANYKPYVETLAKLLKQLPAACCKTC